MTIASLHLMRLADEWHERPAPVDPLDPLERAHAERLPHAMARAGYCLGRLLLKRLVAQRTGLAMTRIRFVPGRHGKPAIPDAPRLSFSVSHVNGAVACLIAEGAAVGVDIEDPARRPLSPAARVRYLDEAERRWLDDAEPAARHDAFLALWTRKEALLKADGRGLAMGLGQVRFGPDGRGVLCLRDSERVEAAAWHVRTGALDRHPWAVAWRVDTGDAPRRLVLHEEDATALAVGSDAG